MKFKPSTDDEWLEAFNEKYPDLYPRIRALYHNKSSDSWRTILQDTPTPVIEALHYLLKAFPLEPLSPQCKLDISPFLPLKNHLFLNHPEYTLQEIERRMEQTPAFILSDFNELIQPTSNTTSDQSPITFEEVLLIEIINSLIKNNSASIIPNVIHRYFQCTNSSQYAKIHTPSIHTSVVDIPGE